MNISIRFKLVCFLLILSLMFLCAGCGAVDALNSLKQKFNSEEENKPEITVENSANKSETEGKTGDAVSQLPDEEQPKNTQQPQSNKESEQNQETIAVELWFSGPDGKELVKEVREIPKVKGIARKTVNQLIKGPNPESNLLPTIPVGTELKDINMMEDGVIRVDFSEELVENHIGEPKAEKLTVYSIVNTLCQYSTVNQVQFLVDGEYVDTISGSVNVSDPVKPKDI